MKNQLSLINSMLPNREPLKQEPVTSEAPKVESKPDEAEKQEDENPLGKRPASQNIQKMFQAITDKQTPEKLTPVVVPKREPVSSVKKLDKK